MWISTPLVLYSAGAWHKMPLKWWKIFSSLHLKCVSCRQTIPRFSFLMNFPVLCRLFIWFRPATLAAIIFNIGFNKHIMTEAFMESARLLWIFQQRFSCNSKREILLQFRDGKDPLNKTILIFISMNNQRGFGIYIVSNFSFQSGGI